MSVDREIGAGEGRFEALPLL